MKEKWAFFVRELLKPVRILPGQMYTLAEEDYLELRSQANDGDVLDVTPNEIFRSIRQHHGMSLLAKPASGAFLVPCPSCMGMNDQGGWFIAKPMAKCVTCQDSRSLVAFNVKPPREAQEQYQKHISELVRKIVHG